jgi:hypothetical protein
LEENARRCCEFSRRKARKTALGRPLEQAFGGSVEPMMHFLVEEKKLSAEQRRELIGLLEAEGEKGEGPSFHSTLKVTTFRQDLTHGSVRPPFVILF